MTITFGTASNISVGIGPFSVDVGYINNDDNLDAVVANSVTKTVSVLLGDGLGGFSAASPLTGLLYNPIYVNLQDLNGDDKLDLATANFDLSALLSNPLNPNPDNNISIFLGNGNGTFGPFTNYNPLAGTGLSAIALEDLDGDGKLDLAAGSLSSPNVSIFPGTGLGTFDATAVTYPVGTDSRAIAVYDFNKDGILDFAQVKTNVNKVFVQLASGEDESGNPVYNNPVREFIVGAQPRSVNVADMNGDGNADLLVANFDHDTVSLLLGDGTGNFSDATTYNAGDGSRFVAVGDFNKDGKNDLLTANQNSNNISVLLNTTIGDNLTTTTGEDYFVVDNIGDTITENPSGGIDTVNSSVTYNLGANLEHLILSGTNDISGTGNTLNNNVVGNGGNNTLDGAGGDDYLYGQAGNDTLIGGDGDDYLFGGAGTNSLSGGNGNDTYYVENSSDIVTEDAGAGFDIVNSSVSFTLAPNIENLILTGNANIDGTGNEQINSIVGNSGNNILNGAGGDDYLHGQGGNDTLIGGLGNDYLNGGVGSDIFRFNASFAGIDTIQDFEGGVDKIEISAAGFGGGLSTGTLNAGAFVSGLGITTAGSSDHRFIYNTFNGDLFFDADGNGTGSSIVRIATLLATPNLTAADISVIA